MWNYWLGGKDNFAVDRAAAERVLEVMPTMPLIARAARLFLVEAVQRLAASTASASPSTSAPAWPWRTTPPDRPARRAGVADRLRGLRPHRAPEWSAR
jgi:S-adenosyl methyltransferase